MARPDPTDKLAAAAPRSGPPRSLVGVLVALVAVVAVVAAIVVGQSASRSSDPVVTAAASTTTSAGKPFPKGATGFGGPLVVNPGAPATVPTLDVFEDPQCPVCKQFETIFGPAVAAMVKANQVKLVVHTMTFLDTNLRNDSSVRAAGAAFCAADQGMFAPYMSAVYAGQPVKEGEGWTDAQLTGFATSVGLSGSALSSWQSCVNAKTYAAHVDAVEVNSEKAGVTGTPTVKLNGQKVSLTTPDDLVAQVKAATK